ncbi:hypothetical protein, partial [Synechococcus sp. R6-6]|uniref:hypothetical protein n=1 Tax=Synechococcus sp. R6-6 TaxID=2291957 RepID=UPI0039C457BF
LDPLSDPLSQRQLLGCAVLSAWDRSRLSYANTRPNSFLVGHSLTLVRIFCPLKLPRDPPKKA